jgi:hypothetical protein
MIESFDPRYRNFFDEPDFRKRWKALTELSRKDYWTYRVLFQVETLAIADHWKEPTPKLLKRLLSHQLKGGVLGIRSTDLQRFILPIWPLEMAKYDVLIYRTFLEQHRNAFKRYFFASLKLHFAAIVQTWWAFETLMNDFGGIIKQARRGALSQADLLVLDEVIVSLDKTGAVQTRTSYQPVEARIRFIYKLLTGQDIDRTGKTWSDLMTLKHTRDVHQHRIGKESHRDAFTLSKRIGIDGMRAVRQVIAWVFEKTPEFAKRFIYTYFRYWSCGMESPFIWDGRCGDGFCLGAIRVDPTDIVSVYAPMPNSVNPGNADLASGPGSVRAQGT